MNIKHVVLNVMAFSAVLVLTSCNAKKEEKVAEAKEQVALANQDLKDAQAAYEKEWKQFKNDADSTIEANEQSIDKLNTKIKKASKTFKAKYEKEVVVLKQKNAELKKKISDYKYEGKDKWVEFKQTFNHDLDVVGKTIKNIFSDKD